MLRAIARAGDAKGARSGLCALLRSRVILLGLVAVILRWVYLIYRYISSESCSPFDFLLPLTSSASRQRSASSSSRISSQLWTTGLAASKG